MQSLSCALATTATARANHFMNDTKSNGAPADTMKDSNSSEGCESDMNGLLLTQCALVGVAAPDRKKINGHGNLNGHSKLNGDANSAHAPAVNGKINGKKPHSTTADEGLPDDLIPRAWSHHVSVRPYQQSDREAFCRLCCDTGFLGGPVEPMFQDRDLFADLFTRPYLEHESRWALVAEVDGEVAGYLLGSVRKHFDAVLMWSGLRTMSKMLLRLVTGRYGRHPRSRRFIRWLLTAGFREQPKHPRDAAHLHIQVDRRYRGRGVAKQLWEYYERELRAVGMRQCYGAFFSYAQRRPELAYSRLGFTVFDRRQTTMFQPEIREPVEVVCVWKKL